ncbi:UPF0145 protein like [Verticillium longisporum]|nr:UPF0145 protein like [Verticillium longisporum]
MSPSRKTEDVAHVPPTLSDLHCFTETEGVITTTMFDIPGYRVVRTLGAVYGLTVRSRNWAAGLGMVLKSIAGGELRWFTTMLYSCRNDAISRVVTETKSRGGNAVIALRFDAGELGGFAQVCAYGTACVVEKIEDRKGVAPQLEAGRQVRAPNRLEAEGTSSAAPSVQEDDPEDGGVNANGRPRRSAAVNYAGNGRARGSRSRGYSADETDDEGDVVEPDLGDDEEEADDHQPEESEEDDDDDVDDDEAMVDDDLEDRPRQELIVELKVKRPNPKDGAKATNLTPSPEGKEEVRHEKPDDQKVPTPKSLQTERTPEPEIVALPGPTSLAFRGSPEKSVAAGSVNDGSAL